MHTVNHGTGTKEEQRLKESMGDDVENRGDKSTYTASQEHVTELRNCRVGKYFLNVVLREANRRRKESCCRSNDRDDKHRSRRMNEDFRATNDHVYAGGHHCCGVDQGGNWSWTSHRVWQPDIQRNLCTLTTVSYTHLRAHETP